MITYEEDRTIGHREYWREVWALVRVERETPETIVEAQPEEKDV